MTKPLWFLDVDGVINAFSHQQQYRAIMVPAAGREWKIRYNTKVIESITDLSEKIDIWWCTTWMDEAATNLAPRLGLPEFPVVEPIKPHEMSVIGTSWWKYWRVFDSIPQGRKIVWTDDDIPNLMLWELNNYPNVLAIRPNFRTGLTLNELNQISSFIS